MGVNYNINGTRVDIKTSINRGVCADIGLSVANAA